MDRAVLRKFLSAGVMVSPEAADDITPEDYEKMMAKQDKPRVLNKEALQQIRSKRNIDVVYQNEEKGELSAKDFLAYYQNKIHALGPSITRRTGNGPVSINKARPGQQNTVLGLAREITDSGFSLEDFTGKCEVVVKNTNDIAENDVVGVSGFFSNGKIFADSFTMPELPVKKNVKKTSSAAKIAFVNLHVNEGQINPQGTEEFVSVSLCETAEGKKGIKILGYWHGIAEEKAVPAVPSKVSVTLGGVVYKIQILQTPIKDSVDNLARIFSKKGYVSGPNTIPVFTEDMNAIDENADIIFLGLSEKAGASNYKGYTFVTVGETDGSVIIDLHTREATLTVLNQPAR
ncbi:MAG: hypothetical protein HY051_04430 [Candidatus Aenigmarchaeota archaeon]|nr:hypothetical protein [Candidatus Aenigmarchaeota archaeon]